MTPLAHQIAREATLPIKRRKFNDISGMLPLSDIHCFECSAVREAAVILQRKMAEEENGPNTYLETVGALGFLPAPRTWIEYIDPTVYDDPPEAECLSGGSNRVGFLPIEDGNAIAAKVHMALGGGTAARPGRIPLMNSKFPFSFAGLFENTDSDLALSLLIISLLSLINTPRIIGRKQHMPHRELERQLTRKFGVGKFPLHAWTEIKLHITPPRLAGDAVHEAHLTGRKALHFVRSHLRVVRGQVERTRVQAHWRGDPALGIKQQRYEVLQ